MFSGSSVTGGRAPNIPSSIARAKAAAPLRTQAAAVGRCIWLPSLTKRYLGWKRLSALIDAPCRPLFLSLSVRLLPGVLNCFSTGTARIESGRDTSSWPLRLSSPRCVAMRSGSGAIPVRAARRHAARLEVHCELLKIRHRPTVDMSLTGLNHLISVVLRAVFSRGMSSPTRGSRHCTWPPPEET